MMRFTARFYFRNITFTLDRSEYSATSSTEIANYTSSYATVSKEIVDMEIGMCQGAEQSDNTATAQ
jgi:hypothetical protein